MVSWAKENAASSGLSDRPIRWLVDDCVKFVEREIRRGNHYDAIIMDPPSYGRGPKGEIWKIEDAIHPLIKLCTKILSEKMCIRDRNNSGSEKLRKSLVLDAYTFCTLPVIDAQ